MIAPGDSHVLTGGLVLRDTSGSPERLDVVIENGAIAALVPPGGPLPLHERLDVSGQLIIPGLVNAHYHSHDVLARGLFEDIPLEVWIVLAILPPGRPVSTREVRLRTLIGAIENLRNGTTTVQDMLGCGPGSEALVETAINAYAEAGMRCVLGLQVGNRPAIDCLPGIRETMPTDVQALISGSPPPVAEFLAFVAGPLSRAGRPLLHWAIAPGSPQRCTLDLLAGLGDLARQHALPLVTHVNESKLQVFLAAELYAEHGGSVLDYLDAAGVFGPNTSMAHGIWFSDAEIERIAAAGASVATCPASNLKLKNGIAPHRALRAAGVPLSLGCDNVSAGDSQNMFEAMRLLAWLNAGKGAEPSGLMARDILHIATQGGADRIGLGDLVGTIAVGRRADLVTLALSEPAYLPLHDAVRQMVYAESGRGVRHVLVDGRIVVRDGAPVGVSIEALAEETTDLAAGLQRDYASHFERMAPAVPYIAAIAREQARKPLPYARWGDAGDGAPSRRTLT